MDTFIRDTVAHIDHVKSVRKSDKQINISFDEWNVWHHSRAESTSPSGNDWPVAPVLLEDIYTVADAVVVGDLLITLLRNTDRVHSASLAQLVNVIAPIMTEPGGRAWKQTTFHPFALTSRHAAGTVLQLAVESPPGQRRQDGGLRRTLRRCNARRRQGRGSDLHREPLGD
jgi:alpha-N-arabinofuranosidase